MSKRSLSSHEESITALGLNFVPASSISENTIIAEIEAVADKDVAKLRAAVQSCLTNPKLPTSNITKGHMQALEKLGEDKDIAILPADKGNNTVEQRKLQPKHEGLTEGHELQLKHNPTTTVE